MREYPLGIDPVLGLEEARRDVLRVSKSAFYGPKGIRARLPVVELSAKRKGVRKSDLEAYLAARTTEHCAQRAVAGPAPLPTVQSWHPISPPETASRGRVGLA